MGLWVQFSASTGKTHILWVQLPFPWVTPFFVGNSLVSLHSRSFKYFFGSKKGMFCSQPSSFVFTLDNLEVMKESSFHHTIRNLSFRVVTVDSWVVQWSTSVDHHWWNNWRLTTYHIFDLRLMNCPTKNHGVFIHHILPVVKKSSQVKSSTNHQLYQSLGTNHQLLQKGHHFAVHHPCLFFVALPANAHTFTLDINITGEGTP